MARQFRPRIIKKKGPCQFCKESKSPDFRQVEELKAFISERGKIIPRIRTGICAKHQKRLTVAIKRARHLALLSFVARA